MNMKYRSLARTFHADRTNDAFINHTKLAQQRLEADSTFRTGVITPLGELFTATPRETSILTEKILLAERQVSFLWNQLPGVMRWNYIRHSISEELFATNEMEGVRSTRKETQDAVDAADKARKSGNESKARFSEFAKLYLNLTDKDTALPSGIVDIRDIYNKVVLDEINESDKPDGELFRKGDVEIQGSHGLAIHNGVKGEGNISALLTDMIHLATSDEIPRLQSSIMSHFLFEYVHPFYDGNGRTGRYLLALYLNHNLTMPTVLSLSRIIAENKNSYYKAFMEAEDKLNCGELTFFVNTILEFIRKAQDELIDELEVRVDQLDRGRSVCNQLEQKHGLSAQAASILYGVIQEEMFDSSKSITLNDAATHIRLSKQSARKYVGELMDTNLVVQSGKRPLKIQASKSLKDILETGIQENNGKHNSKIQEETGRHDDD
ncbi:Fic family protein [Bifidobacterium imperatoris]|uniref:Cell division protein Fic n=1 Tax=Bifidobacterium imperatoris TaxID=2020965 RepID=A0A2N5IQE8_9BIFI|nr:Fic family protein [Bifidobacterium imperatoris]PLS24185.1 cell division protein Fic [Bifidobacterium imperatoris]QSY57321.1 Fic family protein [Bifidobacterium imperatoris]